MRLFPLHILPTIAFSLLLSTLMACSPVEPLAENTDTSDYMTEDPDAALQVSMRHVFAQPDQAMPLLEQLDFAVGRSFFRNAWVQAPATTTARDGLGPLYNANSCGSCHVATGRGLAPLENKPLQHQVVRLSLSLSIGRAVGKAGFIPEPSYGGQLQNQAVPGVRPEGQAFIRYSEVVRTLADGETVKLRKPQLRLLRLGYGEMVSELDTSVRSAAVLTGMGLLEAVPEQLLLQWEDADDADGDGISGRENRVWDIVTQQKKMGRFGWKAEQPSVLQQSAAAFHADMGISSELVTRQNCTLTEVRCQNTENGGTPEIPDKLLERVTLYVANLAVPNSQAVKNDAYIQGEMLFAAAGCQSCHRPVLKTAESHYPWLSNRTIYPYTDLLLHDMGDELADDRPVFSASGREWRTAPLWGIGLAKKVAPQVGFLHDGRARSVLEAILWHGGEAQHSREKVEQMTRNQRHDLLSYIENL
ncbi:MAG: di-heme oxidoredictase family protein [Pseudomonadales bacterium]